MTFDATYSKTDGIELFGQFFVGIKSIRHTYPDEASHKTNDFMLKRLRFFGMYFFQERRPFHSKSNSSMLISRAGVYNSENCCER